MSGRRRLAVMAVLALHTGVLAAMAAEACRYGNQPTGWTLIALAGETGLLYLWQAGRWIRERAAGAKEPARV